MSDARAALEDLVAELLADPGAAHGYRLDSVGFHRAVEIALAKDGATFTVWLRPSEEDTRFYKRTSRFKVGHKGDPPDPRGYAVIDALCARLQAWEQTVAEAEIAGVFAAPASGRAELPLTIEWLAVRSGLKPACRNLVRAAEVPAMATAARAEGLHLEHTDARAFLTGFTTLEVGDATTIVHVGRTAAAALAAATAERVMIADCERGQRVGDDQVRALGHALGYPRCCVEAFLPVRDLSNQEIRFRALQATPGDAHALLNDFLAGEQALVSHCLCRYDCAPSRQYAAALLDEFRRIAATSAQSLQRHLAGVIVAFRDGALRLEATEHGPARRIAYTAVEGGEQHAEWRAALTAGDALELRQGEVRILRGDTEVGRISAPSAEVQVRRFV